MHTGNRSVNDDDIFAWRLRRRRRPLFVADGDMRTSDASTGGTGSLKLLRTMPFFVRQLFLLILGSQATVTVVDASSPPPPPPPPDRRIVSYEGERAPEIFSIFQRSSVQ